MMQALPAAPAPEPRRQLLLGASLASATIGMLVGGMLAVWTLQRTRAHDLGQSWLPSDVTIPEVPANVMLIAFLPLCIFAQWGVWAGRRNDRGHALLALGLTGLIALMIVNAQAFVYHEMGLVVAEGAYAGMFYAVTGTYIALLLAGVIFTVIVAFRQFGGRTDGELLVAHAIFWYAMTAAFAALWYVVYVLK
jgi:heme/copper-type cytochrome/quinol oxidase subunit 3